MSCLSAQFHLVRSGRFWTLAAEMTGSDVPSAARVDNPLLMGSNLSLESRDPNLFAPLTGEAAALLGDSASPDRIVWNGRISPLHRAKTCGRVVSPDGDA